MKTLIAALALVASTAHAAPTTLNCREVDAPNANAEKIFTNLQLKMELPDTTKEAPGALAKQTIAVTYNEGDQATTKSVAFTKKGSSLSASIDYGDDFGGGDFNLFWDYDMKEVVAVIQVSSDGPMNIDIQRCK